MTSPTVTSSSLNSVPFFSSDVEKTTTEAVAFAGSGPP